ncbi:MAG: hypothetical protein COB02_04560 [Candidatus Cloacimonadota bacterium]|nr:MAG: hypothetical protein COB02_04560 [Candidatus Cloacimonadota bacterium]
MAEEKPVIWKGEADCPLCQTKFNVENVWLNRVKFQEVYTDLAKKYESVNPMVYEIWVCPNCFYAAYKKEIFKDISDLNMSTFKQLEPVRKKLGSIYPKNNERTLDVGVLSFKLALVTLQSRKDVSAAKFASFFYRIAWVYRQQGDKDLEVKYMKLALQRYENAYEKEMEPQIGKMGETGLVYTMGELSRRTGDDKKAQEYFMKVITNKEMTGDPKYLKYCRDMLSGIKEGSAPNFWK